MAYDREKGRAFWYEFDARTKYDPALGPVLDGSGAFAIQDIFIGSREDGQYPQAFNAFVVERGESWRQLADLQRSVIRTHFGEDGAALQSAFEDFGQGTLYDPDPVRAQFNDMIHTMDAQTGQPPVGYHRWHASIRAIESLGPDDAQWWSRFASLVGLAWAIQSAARPRQQHQPNPDLAADKLVRLREAWLGLNPSQLDAQYDRTGSTGYHPAPYQPI